MLPTEDPADLSHLDEAFQNASFPMNRPAPHSMRDEIKSKWTFPNELGFSGWLAERLRENGFMVETEVRYTSKGNTFFQKRPGGGFQKLPGIRLDLLATRAPTKDLPFRIIAVENKYVGDTGAIVDGVQQVQDYWTAFGRVGNRHGGAKFDKPDFILICTPESLFEGHLSAFSSKFDGTDVEWIKADGRALHVYERLLWKCGPLSVLKARPNRDSSSFDVGFCSNYLMDSTPWYSIGTIKPPITMGE